MNTPTTPPAPEFRALTDSQIEHIYQNRILEERCLRQFEMMLMDPSADTTFVSIARLRLQEAFMWASRAIAQPRRLSLPEDSQ